MENILKLINYYFSVSWNWLEDWTWTNWLLMEVLECAYWSLVVSYKGNTAGKWIKSVTSLNWFLVFSMEWTLEMTKVWRRATNEHIVQHLTSILLKEKHIYSAPPTKPIRSGVTKLKIGHTARQATYLSPSLNCSKAQTK